MPKPPRTRKGNLRGASAPLSSQGLLKVEYTENEIETRLRNLKATGPRLSSEAIDKQIHSVEYHVFANKTTICCMKLRNGFHVVGTAACVDPANFREQVGRDVSWTNARAQIWQLEGYLLQQKLFDEASGG